MAKEFLENVDRLAMWFAVVVFFAQLGVYGSIGLLARISPGDRFHEVLSIMLRSMESTLLVYGLVFVAAALTPAEFAAWYGETDGGYAILFLASAVLIGTAGYLMLTGEPTAAGRLSPRSVRAARIGLGVMAVAAIPLLFWLIS